ncbi:hypothetical protein SAMN04488564_104214 [Lentzea waywayandensis]|uniref:Uncharacterized protein n=1 Tax=Lentzea waywayandensis TaxID=84724 RepID=A0A1I6EDV8_9PSEU|nr:hypothetical protein SAMN04488564_104214 [Lentzea waywayandensis]
MIRLRILCRMLRNLVVYGRLYPPRFIFKDDKEQPK